MRVFIALEIPDRTKDNLARSARQFDSLATKGNFTVKDNYHITLHFIGNVDESKLIYLQSAMDNIKDCVAPTLSVSQFAVLRASNVVCAKFNKEQNLVRLHEALGDSLEKLGFTVERRAYRPHVTMIRNYGFTLPFSEVTKSVDVYNKPFTAANVVLYQSVFTQNGVSYNKLYEVSLKTEQ